MNPIAADDNLLRRSGLPAGFRDLAAQLPRASWPHSAIHGMARELLVIHDSHRANLASLVGSGQAWAAGENDALAYRRIVLPQLRDFLGYLETHHRVESEHFFPALVAADARMRAMFDLLDRDHDAIHALMADVRRAAIAFDARMAGNQHADTEAAALAASIERLSVPLARHLHDEEDIVVPHLTLRGFRLDAP